MQQATWCLLFFVAFVLSQRVDGRPTQEVREQSSLCEQVRIREKELIRKLGSRRRRLQQHTPMEMCPGGLKRMRRIEAAGQSTPNTSAPPQSRFVVGNGVVRRKTASAGGITPPWQIPDECDPRMIAKHTECPWLMQCTYDEHRYPQFMFEAVCFEQRLPRGAQFGKEFKYQPVCRAGHHCQPVYDYFWVLRRNATSCDWEVRWEQTSIACSCPAATAYRRGQGTSGAVGAVESYGRASDESSAGRHQGLVETRKEIDESMIEDPTRETGESRVTYSKRARTTLF